MPAYIKIGDIQGESNDQDHKDWIQVETMNSAIHRAIPPGARDQARARGQTSIADIAVVKKVDKSSVKLQEACAAGKPFEEVEIHFCMTAGSKQEPFLKYKLKNVILSSYSIHASADSNQEPTEELTLNFIEAEWTYVVLDHKTLAKKGQVAGKYNPSEGK